MAQDIIEYDLPQNSYATFDATTLRNLLVERLTDSGVFTDQIFQGSNMSALIDLLAVPYHLLLFYLNQTASETRITQAQLYENINELVKLIGYNPTGYQTPIVPFVATGTSTVPAGLHTIRRYSFLNINGLTFSLNGDSTFEKNTNDEEILTTLNDNYLLYQGRYVSYPTYTAVGDDFETIIMAVKDLSGTNPVYIDHNNIDVYVQDPDTTIWSQWEKTNSLFLENNTTQKYEIRLNENKNYEIKFGNDTYGKRIEEGARVAIYYLRSDGPDSQINANAISGQYLNTYSDTTFENIMNDVGDTNYLTIDTLKNITFVNEVPSTQFQNEETTESIRQNAPKSIFTSSQLVTRDDFKTFITNQFSGFVKEVSVKNSQEFSEEYINYLTNIGVNLLDDSRFLYNQNLFSTNITQAQSLYTTLLPYSNGTYPKYLTPSQKNTILNAVNQKKVIGLNVIPFDPVYIAFDFGTVSHNFTGTISSTLNITKNTTTRSSEKIRKDAVDTIQTFFDPSTNNLGQRVKIADLTNLLLSIEGVDEITTSTTYNNETTTVQGISFQRWNPTYPQDLIIVNQDIKLKSFMFPYLVDIDTLSSRILVN